MTSGLFFTDAHVQQGEDLKRFEWLGKWIAEHRPHLVVQGGDFGTFDCFSRWDQDKRLKIEGRRYKADVEACREAIKCLTNPIECTNMEARKRKQKQYTPEWIWIEGNHEYWARAYVERNPELAGIIEVEKDLGLDSLGSVEYVPFIADKWWAEREGVYFCHAPRNRTGLISSKYIADRALEVFNGSVIFGHCHRLVYSSCNRTGSPRVYQALSGGSFFQEVPVYAVGHNNDYFSGCISFTLAHGSFSFKVIPLEELKG